MNFLSSICVINTILHNIKKIHLNLKFTLISTLFIIFLFIYQNTLAEIHKGVEGFGDIAQIANPIIAGLIASQEKGLGHFALIYGQNTLMTQGCKLTGKITKWKLSKRPTTPNKTDRYEGMPSGHTSSAWSAPSYLRVFGGRYKFMSIPLYISATITGYSRVKAKKHTTTQVIAAAILTEALTEINSRLNWSNQYQAISFGFGHKTGSFSIEFKL